jgi:hypothetical protein
VAEDLRDVPRDEVADALGGAETAPALDSDAVRRSYYLHRARRKAQADHRRRSKLAGARFWLAFALLVAVCVFLTLTTWREIGRLFGL